MRPVFEVLSDEERAQIHERTLHVLETTGMRVDTPQGRDILREAGAHVDDTTCMVKFPPDLVERSLKSARRELTLGARRPGWSHPTGAGRTTLVAAGEATMTKDSLTGEIRPGTREDWNVGTRLIDAMDEIGVYWLMVSSTEQQQEPAGSAVAQEVKYMAKVQRSFSKHVQDSSENPEAMRYQLEILAAIFGGRDEVARLHPYSFLLTPLSPLVMEQKATEAALTLSGWDIPVAVMPMPMAGTTAPASLAATVLLGNCEVLGCLCLLEAAEPGRPVIYAPIFATMRPGTGALTNDAAHSALGAACTEMARHYGLPSLSFGFESDHVVTDAQIGYEKALSCLTTMLSRPDILVGPGSLGGAMVWSAEQTVIDCEVFRLSERICQGISLDDRLLDDVIGAVGPGGHFLGERSTRRLIQAGELTLPGLGWHRSREAWEASGQPSLLDQAHERVEQLLADHEPVPLPDDVERELQRLVDSAGELS